MKKKPRVYVDGYDKPVEYFNFPSGELHFSFEIPDNCHIYIECDFVDLETLGALLLLNNVIKAKSSTLTALKLGYVWGCRQDRRTSEYEPFTAQVAADIINLIDVENIILVDPHSDVLPALLKANVHVDQGASFFARSIKTITQDDGSEFEVDIVIPDAGATKRVEKIISYASRLFSNIDFNLIQCLKKRDLKTGKLSEFRIADDFDPSTPKIFIDDICDGGGTFIGLAEEFKRRGQTGNMDLLVTHGLFTKGKDKLLEHFKSVTGYYEF